MSPVHTRESRFRFRFVLIAVLAALCMFGLLSVGGMNYTQKAMVAITVLMAMLWITEAVPIAVTALLPIALFPLLGIMPSAQATIPYGNHMVFLFLGGFMIAVAMERSGLHQRIALAIISTIGTRPQRLILGFMAATGFLSMWISNTATVMMLFPVAISVITQLSPEHEQSAQDSSRFALSLLLGIAYAANVGGAVTLVGTPPNIIFAGSLSSLYPGAPGISFGQWFWMVWPLGTIFVIIVWWLLVRRLKDLEFTGQGCSVILAQRAALGPIRADERKVLTVFVLTAFLWFFRQSLTVGQITVPGWTSLLSHGGQIHDATIAMVMGLSLFFLSVNDSEGRRPLLEWKFFEHRVPWKVLLLFGGGFALAAGYQASGLTVTIAKALVTLKVFPPFVLIVATALTIVFLTEVTSNTATASLALPILAPAAVAIGVHPYLILIPATISASYAFMLPVATPPNAIIYGSGLIRMKDMAAIGFTMNLIGAVLLSIYIYLCGSLFLGIDLYQVPLWAHP